MDNPGGSPGRHVGESTYAEGRRPVPEPCPGWLPGSTRTTPVVVSGAGSAGGCTSMVGAQYGILAGLAARFGVVNPGGSPGRRVGGWVYVDGRRPVRHPCRAGCPVRCGQPRRFSRAPGRRVGVRRWSAPGAAVWPGLASWCGGLDELASWCRAGCWVRRGQSRWFSQVPGRRVGVRRWSAPGAAVWPGLASWCGAGCRVRCGQPRRFPRAPGRRVGVRRWSAPSTAAWTGWPPGAGVAAGFGVGSPGGSPGRRVGESVYADGRRPVRRPGRVGLLALGWLPGSVWATPVVVPGAGSVGWCMAMVGACYGGPPRLRDMVWGLCSGGVPGPGVVVGVVFRGVAGRGQCMGVGVRRADRAVLGSSVKKRIAVTWARRPRGRVTVMGSVRSMAMLV